MIFRNWFDHGFDDNLLYTKCIPKMGYFCFLPDDVNCYLCPRCMYKTSVYTVQFDLDVKLNGFCTHKTSTNCKFTLTYRRFHSHNTFILDGIMHTTAKMILLVPFFVPIFCHNVSSVYVSVSLWHTIEKKYRFSAIHSELVVSPPVQKKGIKLIFLTFNEQNTKPIPTIFTTLYEHHETFSTVNVNNENLMRPIFSVMHPNRWHCKSYQWLSDHWYRAQISFPIAII